MGNHMKLGNHNETSVKSKTYLCKFCNRLCSVRFSENCFRCGIKVCSGSETFNDVDLEIFFCPDCHPIKNLEK